MERGARAKKKRKGDGRMKTEERIADIELEIAELKEAIKERKKKLEDLITQYAMETDARNNDQQTLEDAESKEEMA